MKTAEEAYMEVQDIELPKINNLILPEEWQIKVMRFYAKQVAKQALKDAAERLSSDKIIAKKIILSTPIKLP